MTLFKYAIKNFKKEPVVNILTILQLTALIVIVVIMTSSVLIRYRYYAPFKDILQSNGIFCDFSLPANYDEQKLQDPFKYIADDEIKNLIPYVEDVVSCNFGPCWFVDENQFPLDINFSSLFYDNDMIERYEPELSQGCWLQTSTEADCIECVISENDFGLKVGDKVKIAFTAFEEKDLFQEVLIVGMLTERTKVIGYQQNRGTLENPDITTLYGSGIFNADEELVVLLSSDYLSEHTTIIQGMFGPALITFKEGTSAGQIKKSRTQLSDYNAITSYSFSEMNANSRAYVFEQVKNLLPIIIVLVVMTVVSGVSSSALSTRRELKSFAVLYITGLRWKQCALISLLHALITAASALVLSGVCIWVLKLVEIDIGILLILQWETIFCVLAIIGFFVLMSLLMPLLMLSQNTPKQILTR